MEEKLEDKIIRLEKENAYLKSLLKHYGIKHRDDNSLLFKKASENNVRYFMNCFGIRNDVYARRVISNKRVTKFIGGLESGGQIWGFDLGV